MYGSAGTGKTLILIEALKIKLSKSHNSGQKVKIIVTTFYDSTELRKDFRTKYLLNFLNIADIEVLSFPELCASLNLKCDYFSPRDSVNNLIEKLSSQDTDTITLLLIDEVLPCYRGQTEPNWSQLALKDNVVWLLGMTSRAWNTTKTKLDPPLKNSRVLVQHLVYKQRNCFEIRDLKTFTLQLQSCNSCSMRQVTLYS